MKNKENGRESGIELLKMLSVILIVISHTTYTFFQENSLFSNEYIIPLNHATRNIQYWILTWMSFWGQQGNLLFFVASAWFLVDKDEVNIRKCIKLILDSQVISVIFLFVIGRFTTLSPLEIIINIFPTRWELYWYIPFYIIFYLIHGHINLVIRNLSQKSLLIFCVSMLLLYFGLNYLHKGYFFFSNMTIFITVYLVVSYMKKYMISFYANRSVNKICAILGIGITPILIVITNYLGLYYSFFEDKVRMWGGNNSPFMLLTAIALFNLFRGIRFTNSAINKISSMSLLIYIIHENYLFRFHIRPYIYVYVYENIGYEHIVLLNISIALLHYLVALGFAYIYTISVQKIVYCLGNILYEKLYKFVDSCFEKLLLFLK